MIRNRKDYRGAGADIIVEQYLHGPYGWFWRVLYKYDFQNRFTIYENGMRERPSEERIAQIIKNI